ncbi:MAG: leucine-rich repeat domain-containing protein [Promethearchaeota archaeon]
MKLSPELIYKEFKNGNLEKQSVINQLFTLINNFDDPNLRIDSIEILIKIGSKDSQIFNLLENILISDSHEEVRNTAIKAIKQNFIEKALKPMKWAFQHENSINCLISIVSTIGLINNDKAKSFLIDKIKNFDIYEFNESLQKAFNTERIYDLTNKRLSEILNNFMLIKHFRNEFKDISYSLDEGLVSSIDLSGISTNVFGWKILRKLPEFITTFKYIKKLDLKINRIAKLPKNLSKLINLTYLDLSNNNLRSLPESFGSLSSLEYLYLKYNKINEIPSTIGKLEKLIILDLRHNNIKSLPNEISSLNSLEILDIHGNRLNNFPKFPKGFNSLTELQLGLNQLKSLPDSLINLKSLKILGLGGNDLTVDLYLLNKFSSLKVLDLYDNNIRTLPNEIGELNSLETLILRNNKLINLPESFKNLNSLKKLDLSWNDLTMLPEWIDSLSSLEELNLWGNNLKSLPKTIGNLSSLKVLNLNFNNYIRKIPDSLKALQDKGLKIYK